jgi:hypothetical protein
MKKVTKSHDIITAILLFLVVIIVLGGCDWWKHDHHQNPTAPGLNVEESGEFFAYMKADVAGITIIVDFNRSHLAGQPYGNWQLKAEWLAPDNQVVAEKIVSVAIDAAGKGTALLPVDLLDAVFTEANARHAASQDQSLWLQRPGLRLGFFPDEETWSYYQFD